MLLKILTTWPCQAVELDYWLRGESADESALTLRREPRFASIALICYGQERDHYILHSALAAGCDAAIGKPGTPARCGARMRCARGAHGRHVQLIVLAISWKICRNP